MVAPPRVSSRFPTMDVPRILFASAVLALATVAPASTHLRVYMLGNSLTDDILYNGFTNLVTQAGDSVTLGSQRIPGASIQWLWNNPASGFTASPFSFYPNAFANHTWDVVTLQPFSGFTNELAHARHFSTAVRGLSTFGPGTPAAGTPTGISPDATLFIYAQWPSNLLAGWNPAVWLANDPANRDTAAYYHAFVRDLRTLEAPAPAFLIPVGHVFHELHALTRAGRIPGVVQHGDWMQDGIHLNDRGSYVAGLTFASTLYRRDPRGSPVPAPYPVSAAQAAVIQAAVWRVISNHPLTGIPTGLVVTTPSLPDALAGAPYTTTLAAELNAGAVTWSVAAGTLPAGLTLAADGSLSGTATVPGVYDVTLRATDGTQTAERAYILFVLSNNPPRLTTGALPEARVGTPFRVALQHTGGFGAVSWQVLAGDLPLGLTLAPSGVLSGTPLSAEGLYVFTVRATDAVGATATEQRAILLGPPENGTISIGPAAAPPTTDGDTGDGAWPAWLPFTAVLEPGVAPAAAFSTTWEPAALHIAARVPDDDIRDADDAVHILIDALHDREAVFNADDRQFIVRPDGAWSELNGRTTGVTVAVGRIAGGWSVEARIPLEHLGLAPAGRSLAVGFDIAVVDVDTASAAPAIAARFGTDPRAATPASMGNLALRAGPVARDLLVNGDFSNTNLVRPPFPARAVPSMAGQGWVANGVPSRTFSRVDATGYGLPDHAIEPYGDTAVCLYQVIRDNRASTGRGHLRFDARYASPGITYRLFAYNGTDTEIAARMGVQSQQHPANGGTPDATLLAGTLASLPFEAAWREVSIPVDFGPGYDMYILAFSAPNAGVSVDARIDNVALGATAPLEVASGRGAGPGAFETLLLTDLAGTNPALSVPWTRTTALSPHLAYSGITAGAGVNRVAGNDGFFFNQNSGSTRATLAHAIASNHFVEFTLSMTDGAFDIAGHVLQVQVNRQGNNDAPRRFALFSSVAGFAEPAALGVSPAVFASGTRTLLFRIPETAAYDDLGSITFRVYLFDGVFSGKTMSLQGFALNGVAEPLPAHEVAYAAWSAGIPWAGADASPGADPNLDGLPNLLEFAMGLASPHRANPVAALPRLAVVPNAGGPPWLTLTYRRSTASTGLVFSLLASSNLATWTPVVVDGIQAFEELEHADPDGDGRSEARRFRVALSTPPVFLRLAVAPAP